MNRMWLLLPLAIVAGDACAQKRVYKCADGQQVIYQTVPCPKEQDTGITRPVVRDPKLTWEERDRAARDLYVARRRMQAEAGRDQPPVRGTVIGGAADQDACDEARFRRDLAETFSGKKPTQAVDDAVSKACASR